MRKTLTNLLFLFSFLSFLSFQSQLQGQCPNDGGNIATLGGQTEITICAGDGVSDAFEVSLTGAEGDNSAWIITDEDGNILRLPFGPPFPFDLEGAGEGVCLIWHLSFETGVQGIVRGRNVNDLEGCHDLSNPITVNRIGVNGGRLTTADGERIIDICAGDGNSDAFDVILTGNQGSNSAWVITDADANILALPDAPPFDLEGAGAGVCLVWHLSYEDGLTGAEVGMNANDLEGCYDLSNFIRVNRTGINGGELTTADGQTEITICAGDGNSDAFDVELTGNEGSNSAWVITDADANILALPDAPPFDLEGAGGGVCLVWHLSFEDGLEGAAVGNNASDLEGCFDLSNPITVNRIPIEGGELTTADGATELSICAGDGLSDAFDVSLSGNVGSNSAWVITDEEANILALPEAPPFDLEGAGGGTCLVWHLSFEDGLTGAEVGNNASDLEGCYQLSNPITVYRNPINGGDLTTADGGTVILDCPGPGEFLQTSFDVNLENVEGPNSVWIVTDMNGIMKSFPLRTPFDFDRFDAEGGMLYHLSFVNGVQGIVRGRNVNDISGCHDLSNPIIVDRDGVEGGELTTADGETEITICAGDGVSDAFDVNLSGNDGPNSAWVITDADGNILALPEAPPFDLEGAGAGVCLVWHLSFDEVAGAEVGMNANDLSGCYDLSNPITVNRMGVDGGMLMTADSTTELTICAGDGLSDAFDVILTDNVGSNSAWVITDDEGNILALPEAPPFDLEGAGDGICLVWHLSFEDGLEGAEVGNNANDLSGCFDLSNPITVNRTGVDGGMLMTADSTTELSICAGDGLSDAFDVILTDNVGANSAWVITDDEGNILALPNAPPFDLDGAGPGVCLVWHLSFEDGLEGAEVGMNANDLSGCFDLSNPITVNRNGVDGGMLMTADSTTELSICAGDGLSDAFDVILTDNVGSNSAWVITDTAGNILALPEAPPFDLEGAGPGICLVWHLSFEDGLEGAEVGMNANDLSGCFDLSNPITVDRTGVDGGMLTTANEMTEVDICAGDGLSDAFDVILTDNVGSNSAWVITDTAGNILALPDAPPFDLEGAGPGICLVWHLSFEDGLEGAEVGMNAGDLSGCFDLSNPITVNRTAVAGGMLMTADSTTELSICAGDGISDAFDVILTDNIGSNSAWVVTDTAGNILALPEAPPFDLEGAGGGICLVWHLSYEGGLQGAEVGMNAADLNGCFDLSNPITVNRTGVDGGMVMTTDSLTMVNICVGDSIPDSISFMTTVSEGNFRYVITDDNNMILGLPDSSVQDFEGAGFGVCRVWGLSYTGDFIGMVGDDAASDSLSTECYALSSNFIEVVRDTSGEACSTPLVELQPQYDPGFVKMKPYPNPASNQLRIDIELDIPAENLQLEVYDLFGRRMFSKDLGRQEGLLSEEVDLSSWPEGSYLINLRTENWVKPYRFLKK